MDGKILSSAVIEELLDEIQKLRKENQELRNQNIKLILLNKDREENN